MWRVPKTLYKQLYEETCLEGNRLSSNSRAPPSGECLTCLLLAGIVAFKHSPQLFLQCFFMKALSKHSPDAAHAGQDSSESRQNFSFWMCCRLVEAEKGSFLRLLVEGLLETNK